MLSALWLIPMLPLAGFVVLILTGTKLPRLLVGIIAVGLVLASFIVTVGAGWEQHNLYPPPPAHEGPMSPTLHGPTSPVGTIQTLYRWMNVAVGDRSYTVGLSFYFDPLALIMCVVVTFVGALILLYSTRYMRDDEGYSRFFAFMSLFVGSMLTLVLAGNLVLLYLGWEGVGLCSYLLIGFWYREPGNARAAFKAFLVTRIGDVAMLVGLLLLFTHLHTLDIQEVMQQATAQWPVGSALAVAAAALLLGGAVGKSAQLPLQTWLPDAMAGPTPVSALIHAATMVTAGVYLIARTHVLFELAPIVLWIVGVIGAATLLIAAGSALVQSDIKRVLAYSTMSQIGYMFLALGVGAWSAAIFHLFTHAFFKSLLFLGAGLVIMSLHEEQNLLRMGGLRRELPLAFWSLLIGAASLSAVPLVTAGFFSKDAILSAAWAAGQPGLWLAGLVGALLTSIYSFRLIFLAFFGEKKHETAPVAHPAVTIALVVLSLLALTAGFLNVGWFTHGAGLVTNLLHGTFPAARGLAEADHAASPLLAVLPGAMSLLGIAIAALLYLRPAAPAASLAQAPPVRALHRFLLSGWGFDWLYSHLFVRPYQVVAGLLRSDPADTLPSVLAGISIGLHVLLSYTQTGRVRTYVAVLAMGVIIAVMLVVLR